MSGNNKEEVISRLQKLFSKDKAIKIDRVLNQITLGNNKEVINLPSLGSITKRISQNRSK